MRLAMIREVERKELNLFFAAPIGYLFLALFLAVLRLRVTRRCSSRTLDGFTNMLTY